MTSTPTLKSGLPLLVWIVLCAAGSVVFTLGFACAAPLAACAAMAAVTFNTRNALLVTAAAWLANQIVGYGVLHYPLDANSLAWGAVIGASAFAAVCAVQAIAPRFQSLGAFAVAALALIVGFAVYEGVLFAAAIGGLGGVENYTLAIVLPILKTNALAMLGLFIVNWLSAYVRPATASA